MLSLPELRYWVAAYALASLVLGCETPQRLESGRVRPLREALLRAPMACTEQGPIRERIFSRERSEAKVCRGWMQWDVAAGLQLDVIRYGTIVEMRIDEVTYVREVTYPSTSPLWGSLRIARMRGQVTDVLKGSAPVGPAEFPVMTHLALGFPLRRRGSHRADKRGGWSLINEDNLPWPAVALVFLPTEQITDGIFLGCGEGHAVRSRGDAGEEYLRDVRRITKHLRETDAALLARQPANSNLVRDLAARGGRMMGYYLAERCAWHVALSLLEEPTGPDTISSFQLGLLEGLLRMRRLVRTGRFHADGWRDANNQQIDLRLVRWAVFVLLFWDEDADADEHDPVLDAAVRVLHLTKGPLPDVSELGLPVETLEALAMRLGTTNAWTYSATPTDGSWHVGERLDPWVGQFNLRDRGYRDPCRSMGRLSASHRLLYGMPDPQ